MCVWLRAAWRLLAASPACSSHPACCAFPSCPLVTCVPAHRACLPLLPPALAGGGASVIYADTVGDLGYAHEVGGWAGYVAERGGWVGGWVGGVAAASSACACRLLCPPRATACLRIPPCRSTPATVTAPTRSTSLPTHPQPTTTPAAHPPLSAPPQLGNYAEYSGGPNTQETYAYARTLLEAATAHPGEGGCQRALWGNQPVAASRDGRVQPERAPCSRLCPCARAPPADGRGRALIVGGGIANFTDVAATFKGIVQVGWVGLRGQGGVAVWSRCCCRRRRRRRRRCCCCCLAATAARLLLLLLPTGLLAQNDAAMVHARHHAPPPPPRRPSARRRTRCGRPR